MQQARYTVNPVVEENKYHFHAIKTHLTPSLELQINDLREEICMVMQQEIGTSTGESVSDSDSDSAAY